MAPENNDNQSLQTVNTSIPSWLYDNRIVAKVRGIVEGVKRWKFAVWAKKFNPSQWCYFTSALLCIYYLLSSTSFDVTLIAGWIAFAGLTRELLHLFQRMWDTTLGKSIVLILYASTANIAFAYAAMKINLITGIEPTSFVFTLGFTTLVMMPFWITVSTVFLFMTILIIANLWILIRLPLKLLGFNVQLHWEDRHRALLTMALRIALIPVAINSIASFTAPYFVEYIDEEKIVDAISQNAPTLNEPTKDEIPALEASPADSEESTSKAIRISDDSDISPLDKDQSHYFNIGPETTQEDLIKARETNLFIRKIIANFIWYFEAYPNSACIKPENTRSVPIDENIHLIIQIDESQEIGYAYQVQRCVPNIPE